MELVKKEEKNSRYYDDITQVKGFRIICYLYLGAKRCTIKIMQKMLRLTIYFRALYSLIFAVFFRVAFNVGKLILVWFLHALFLYQAQNVIPTLHLNS